VNDDIKKIRQKRFHSLLTLQIVICVIVSETLYMKKLQGLKLHKKTQNKT
jgi:hypothetical protein